jgi:hypothetical protein
MTRHESAAIRAIEVDEAFLDAPGAGCPKGDTRPVPEIGEWLIQTAGRPGNVEM